MKMSVAKKISLAVVLGAATAVWNAHKDLKEEFTKGSFNHYCQAETVFDQKYNLSDTSALIVYYLSKTYCPEKKINTILALKS